MTNKIKKDKAIKSAGKTITKSDALFKTIMEDLNAAREFLEHYLPIHFKELVDLSTIKVEKESFVEDDLKRALSDIVYSIKTKEGEDTYAFILIEQQSKPDYLIAFRLWKYMLLLIDRYIKDNSISSNKGNGNDSNSSTSFSNKSKLPLIMPIVFYNGTKKYNAPRSLWDLFVKSDQAKKLMTDDYKLVDLQSMHDDEIKQKAHFGMIEYFMKHINTRDTLKLWADFLASFKNAVLLDKERGYIYIKHLLWYTDSKIPEDKQQELNNLVLDNLNKSDGENIMRTIAQKYIDEGRQEGEQIGIKKIASNMIKKGFDQQLIAQMTGLRLAEINKLKKI